MKKITIPVLLLLFAINVTAQKEYDSIKRVIENYNGATNIIIPNIRQMMMDKLDSNDLHGARIIYNYAADALLQQNIIAFFEYERLMLAYILNDERFLLEEMNRLNSGRDDNHLVSLSRRKYRYPTGDDDLGMQLRNYSTLHFEGILNNISVSPHILPEQAAILKAYYRFMLKDEENENFSAVRIQKETKQLLGNKYSGPYSYLVNTVIIENVIPTKLHFTFEAGAGAAFRGKDIKHYMPVMVSLDFRTGITYKRSIFEASFLVNGAKLKKPLPVKNELWQQDSSIVIQNVSATLGYFVIDNKRIAMYPFAGATMAWMQPEYNGPTQSKKTVSRSGAGMVAGIAFQYKLKGWSYRYSSRKGGDFYDYFGLRLSYMSRSFADPALKTSAFQCTISIMGNFGERVFFLPWSWFNGTRKGGRI